mmetsp:Transcript_89194/g.273178  ORF Transcript_89194/g.273178 Transcript_89194/m.273178 type:complete len:279 (-) Transcript_89194:146-982(-)
MFREGLPEIVDEDFLVLVGRAHAGAPVRRDLLGLDLELHLLPVVLDGDAMRLVVRRKHEAVVLEAVPLLGAPCSAGGAVLSLPPSVDRLVILLRFAEHLHRRRSGLGFLLRLRAQLACDPLPARSSGADAHLAGLLDQRLQLAFLLYLLLLVLFVLLFLFVLFVLLTLLPLLLLRRGPLWQGRAVLTRQHDLSQRVDAVLTGMFEEVHRVVRRVAAQSVHVDARGLVLAYDFDNAPPDHGVLDRPGVLSGLPTHGGDRGMHPRIDGILHRAGSPARTI